MKISVCIPAYNRPNYLRSAIQSVLLQTFRDFELIVVDDASPQNLEPVIKEFHDNRIRFFRNKVNVNYVKNWNLCLEQARGEYIKFLLDDDVFKPHLLERQAAVLQQFPSVGFVGCRYDVIDADGKPHNAPETQKEQYRLFLRDTQEPGTVFIREYLLGKRAVGLPTSIMFRRALMRTSGFNPEVDFAADIDMWMDLALRSDFYYIDEELCSVRFHSGTVSQSVTQRDVFNYRHLYTLVSNLYTQLSSTHQTDSLASVRNQAYWRISHLAITNAFRNANATDRRRVLKDILENDPILLNRAKARLLWTTIKAGRTGKRLIGKQPI